MLDITTLSDWSNIVTALVVVLGPLGGTIWWFRARQAQNRRIEEVYQQMIGEIRSAKDRKMAKLNELVESPEPDIEQIKGQLAEIHEVLVVIFYVLSESFWYTHSRPSEMVELMKDLRISKAKRFGED